ncbi:hypothetical protein PRZ48_001750 [Zasmidium cellare]|uniref:Uncharacterized protein n=1 Tax=Zasmidium cellare TaxID=395010 RepID=A0ABR0F3P1_ZASCE|nr:hypothetical protein PRZ48_001750 [Zasmidium cellare]
MVDSHTPSPKPTGGLSGGTKRAGVFVAAAGAVGMLLIANTSKKTTTNNPIETNATKNISDRFSAGGAKGEYTPGAATPRRPDDISAPVVDEGKKDEQATDHLKSKQYNFHGSRCKFSWRMFEGSRRTNFFAGRDKR